MQKVNNKMFQNEYHKIAHHIGSPDGGKLVSDAVSSKCWSRGAEAMHMH
jgi:hypothetical protein